MYPHAHVHLFCLWRVPRHCYNVFDWFCLITIMMMMNCFCGMFDRQKALSFISNRDHCQRFVISQISDALLAVFEPAQNLSLGLVE